MNQPSMPLQKHNSQCNMIRCLHSYSDADEHHLLPKCEKIPIIVYDQEPSSIIAYTIRYDSLHSFVNKLGVALTIESKNQAIQSLQSKEIPAGPLL